ncbi:recombinase family protein [Vreelandella massiliensis]|uniref:recombinase family protein n=1 Tax=Vreelandella massiliensis TaxID=1816686 RepID=UPI00096A7F97|nr:recombinase family protein [Halomonas massiliensis]
MPKAISYIRFSSGRQGKGSTTERQKALIQQWLSDNPDIQLSHLSQEDLGKSGFRGDHLQHGLGRILEAIEEDKICPGDFILVEAIDRIGRLEPFDMISLIQDIVAKDVNIVTLEDQQTYSRNALNNNFSSLYILIGKIQQAHHYSKSLSNRLIAAYEAKRRKARAGEDIRIITPFWLDKEGSLIPEKAEITKKCIDFYLKGYGTRKIILMLLDDYEELKGVHPTTLKRWFQHRALIGEWENKGDHIRNVFEPLIDHATFYRLQKQIKERARVMSPEQTYDLSGLVKCSQCGSRYYYRRKYHNHGYIIYSNCSTYLKRGKPFCNNNKTWPYQVLMAIHDLTFDMHLGKASFDYAETGVATEIETLKSERQEISDQVDNLLEILLIMPKQQNTVDKMTILNNRMMEIDAKIYSLESSLIKDEVVFDSDCKDNPYWYKLIKLANDQQFDIVSDSIYLRETLKKSAYEILGNDDTMVVKTGPSNFVEFTLVRRSQKYACYIVKRYTPAYSIPLADDESVDVSHKEETVFFAVNYKGIIVSSSDESRLLNELEKRDGDAALEYLFTERAELYDMKIKINE